jgi:transcription antitermination factor NusG
MSFWGVVRSLPQRERFAADRVEALGYPVFLPMVQRRTTTAPLFSSYFFAQISEQWRSITTCFGVLCLVRVGECPARCPDADIERLKSMIVGGCVQLPEAPSKPARYAFRKDERVRIMGGPFLGVAALHRGMRAADREVLLLSLLGAQRQVKVPSHLVLPAA